MTDPNPFVEKLRGFAPLDEDDVAALTTLTKPFRVFGPRSDLIREGDNPGPMFIVLKGWACRYKVLGNGSRQITAFMMPGDTCDLHVSMLTTMDHSIQTLSAAHIAVVPAIAIEILMIARPNIARGMYLAQLVDESTLRAWIVSLGRRSSIERTAHLLLELYIRGSRAGIAETDVINLPFSQAVIADALGMTSVHVNRVLGNLRGSGAISLQRGMLHIHNPVLLPRIAGYDETYLHKRLPPTLSERFSRASSTH